MRSPSWSWSRLRQLAGSVLGIGLLLFSWSACYLWIMGMTEGWGAPWDVTSIRPPVGYWQRSLNDFFESGPGMYLPTAVFLTISLVLYIRSLIGTRAVATTSFVFAATNLIALVALIAIVIPIQIYLIRTPAHLTPQDWSYWGDFRREWPLTLVAFVLLAGLFLSQPRLVRRLTRVMNRTPGSVGPCVRQ
jgi:amino acid permease